MGQTYFQFKKFMVHQDRSGMKVSTDGCIFGAWIPLPQDTKHVLDVGTGTGLLALMIAQRNKAFSIDAIEIDTNAVSQAVENVNASPFSDQINVLHTDARTYSSRIGYDLIICNPPFFSNDLSSPDAVRHSVRHDDNFTAQDLVALADKCLAPGGRLAVLWPYRRMEEWVGLANSFGFHLASELRVQHTNISRISVIASVWTKEHQHQPLIEQLIMKDGNGKYSPSFISLLGDFYLNL